MLNAIDGLFCCSFILSSYSSLKFLSMFSYLCIAPNTSFERSQWGHLESFVTPLNYCHHWNGRTWNGQLFKLATSLCPMFWHFSMQMLDMEEAMVIVDLIGTVEVFPLFMYPAIAFWYLFLGKIPFLSTMIMFLSMWACLHGSILLW